VSPSEKIQLEKLILDLGKEIFDLDSIVFAWKPPTNHKSCSSLVDFKDFEPFVHFMPENIHRAYRRASALRLERAKFRKQLAQEDVRNDPQQKNRTASLPITSPTPARKPSREEIAKTRHVGPLRETIRNKMKDNPDWSPTPRRIKSLAEELGKRFNGQLDKNGRSDLDRFVDNVRQTYSRVKEETA
jgi:hypothetical protein